jgi:PKD repeat protein
VNTWYWSFGDGSSAITRNPTHTYTSGYQNPAAYSVYLIVQDTAMKSNRTDKAGYIIVDPAPTPTPTPTPPPTPTPIPTPTPPYSEVCLKITTKGIFFIPCPA